MNDTHESAYEKEWVIWNGANGLLTTVTIGRIEEDADDRKAWLDEPFDMVGPFSLDELEIHGQIAFAACLVMSRQRWLKNQLELRRESMNIRRSAEERVREKVERSKKSHTRGHNHGYNGYQVSRQPFNDRQHRETLKLPMDGNLESRQINAAYRRLAQKAHPDVGGSNEQFVRITEARNALLEYIS